MKNNFLRLLLMMACGAAWPVFGQGTAFTYQGQLVINGGAANANYDFTFALYANSNAATQVGTTVTNLDVGVTNGLFTTTIDFGQGIFTGPARWLEIGVRSNGSAGAFTALLPLQPVNPVPYAITANSASNLLGIVSSGSLSGTYANALTFNNASDSFAGNGAGLTNVTASKLGGLPSSNYWQTAGNSGIVPLLTNYLGAEDNEPFELHVNAQRALRLEPGTTPNVIGGYSGNSVTPGVTGATIAGGGASGANNQVTAVNGTVGGGAANAVTSPYGTVSGGSNNLASAGASSVGGGSQNTAGDADSRIGGGTGNNILSGADHSTIAGGENNTIQASGFAATIGGGNNNTNNGNIGTISGGQNNLIAGGGYQPSIGGGYGNVSSNWYAAILGGYQNTNGGDAGAIAGGQNNLVGNFYQGAVGGGYNNQADNNYATVPGGYQNVASGQVSFAAGNQANALHQGAFVWADSQGAAFSSTSSNQFLVRAQGGVGVNMNNPNGASLYVQGNRSNGFNNAVAIFENKGTVSNVSPALRVLVDGGTPMDGALSVSANVPPTGTGFLAKFGNTSSFVTVVSNDGTIYAPGFVGNATGVSGVGNVSGLGNGEIASGSGLDGIAVETNLYMTANPIYLRGDNGIDHNHGLAYCGYGITNFPNTNVQPDGPVLWGFSGGALAVMSGGPQAMLSWSNTGVTINGTLNATNLAVSGLVPWQAVSGSTQAAANAGYIATSGSQVAVTLPTTANPGDIVRVSGGGSGGWKVTESSGQIVYGNFYSTANFRNTWTAASGTTAYWTAVASSGDGTHMVAVGSDNFPYPSIGTSTNAGVTWSTNNNSPPLSWVAVTSSFDGTHLVAGGSGSSGSGSPGGLYMSVNSGSTWVSNTAAPVQIWASLASSYNGSILFAGAEGGGSLNISYNAGVSWTTSNPTNDGAWHIACSSTGSNVWAADGNGGYLYHSVNAGGSWGILNSFNDPLENWQSIACSADGTRIVVCGVDLGDNSQPMWYSANSGSTWTALNVAGSTNNYWLNVVSSASGQYLEAVATGYNHASPIYYSTNFGSTWTTASTTTSEWNALACSADGLKLVAVQAGVGSQIYYSQEPTTPSSSTTTGFVQGGQATATELQYVGANTFMQISHEGDIFAQ